MADSDQDSEVYRTTFDTDENRPNVDVTETVAELKDVETEELTPLYGCLDNVLDNVFSNPPSPEARVEITFTYEGFRITIFQDGRATFRPE